MSKFRRALAQPEVKEFIKAGLKASLDKKREDYRAAPEDNFKKYLNEFLYASEPEAKRYSFQRLLNLSPEFGSTQRIEFLKNVLPEVSRLNDDSYYEKTIKIVNNWGKLGVNVEDEARAALSQERSPAKAQAMLNTLGIIEANTSLRFDGSSSTGAPSPAEAGFGRGEGGAYERPMYPAPSMSREEGFGGYRPPKEPYREYPDILPPAVRAREERPRVSFYEEAGPSPFGGAGRGSDKPMTGELSSRETAEMGVGTDFPEELSAIARPSVRESAVGVSEKDLSLPRSLEEAQSRKLALDAELQKAKDQYEKNPKKDVDFTQIDLDALRKIDENEQVIRSIDERIAISSAASGLDGIRKTMGMFGDQYYNAVRMISHYQRIRNQANRDKEEIKLAKQKINDLQNLSRQANEEYSLMTRSIDEDLSGRLPLTSETSEAGGAAGGGGGAGRGTGEVLKPISIPRARATSPEPAKRFPGAADSALPAAGGAGGGAPGTGPEAGGGFGRARSVSRFDRSETPGRGFARSETPSRRYIVPPRSSFMLDSLPPEERERRLAASAAKRDYEGVLLAEAGPEMVKEDAERALQREELSKAATRTEAQWREKRPTFRTDPAYLKAETPTSADATFVGEPGWMGGPHGVRKQVIEQAIHQFNEPYESYQGERIAPFAESEKIANSKLREIVEDPDTPYLTRRAIERALQASETSILDQMTGRYLDPATAEMGSDIRKYMNPYEEEVIDRYEKKANKEFTERILPKVMGKLSTRGPLRGTAINRGILDAIAEHEERIGQNRAGMLHKGYETALGGAERERARLLQAGELGARLSSDDLDRMLDSSRTAVGLATAANAEQRLNVDALQQQGAKARQLYQQGLSMQYEDWLRRKEYESDKLRELAGIVNRVEPVGRVQYGARPVNPAEVGTSPFTVAGTMGANIIANQLLSGGKKAKAAAKGGRIRKAGGGSITDVPERIELINQMRERQQDLRNTPDKPPILGFIRNLTEGMSQGRPGDLWGNMMRAIPHANRGWDDVVAGNEARLDRDMSLQTLIAQSQALQKERELNYRNKREEFDLRRQMLGLREGRGGLSVENKSTGNMIPAFGLGKWGDKLKMEELKKVESDAAKAVKELELIKKLEKESEGFENFGSPAIDYIPKPLRQYFFKRDIDKIEAMEKYSSDLSLTKGEASQEALKTAQKAVPNPSMQGKAFSSTIKGIKTGPLIDIAKAEFVKTWQEMMGTGGGVAEFAQFSQKYPIIQDGELNEEILNNMPYYLNDYIEKKEKARAMHKPKSIEAPSETIDERPAPKKKFSLEKLSKGLKRRAQAKEYADGGAVYA